ncbi:MAG TPA: bifunctional methylenetetrahydrofolate dehydrogenase/methenyltetrahydrofolate cyclohydrolase FolD [Burkholderiales bacterium]|jgi:methylenetetrahydrofolate dehydrogenase (NADP+)/methenyltetrahydrofolate cyclohydrolase|nr:bifunctional methylenetetrahydrofolate dehydrogenase/methenyltetrahydrofolate cyclohydrolase FolD [Burkholderiales bacterium]
MAAQILDGKSLAAQLRAGVKASVARLSQRGITPGLSVILAGDDPASRVYVRHKRLACEETGIRSELHEYGSGVSGEELLDQVAALNADRAIHGILVQLPLPRHIDAARVLASVSPRKDVDGFHAANLGALVSGAPGFVPCTPAGVMRLLEHARVPIAGRRAVVIGRSNIVGKPLALLLLRQDATVTICHSKTRDLEKATRDADILIAAVGRAKLVTAGMVQPGACVIDVGVNRGADGKLAGDVDFEPVKAVAGSITPVPGGVGPMTIAMLLENCLHAATVQSAA